MSVLRDLPDNTICNIKLFLLQSRTQLECLHGRADEFKEYGYNAVLMQSDSVKYALMQHVLFFFLLQPFVESLSKCLKHGLYNPLKARSKYCRCDIHH